MQEGAETTSTLTSAPNVELKNPFEHATPLGPEHTPITHSQVPEAGATIMTEHHPYQPPSRQEEELMRVISEASGGDAEMLKAMRSAMPSNETPTATIAPKIEPTGFKGILYKTGKGIYGILVAISRMLGVKPMTNAK
ncbi:MAG: hypothetical protein ACOYUB_00570 [Patescibacteria group bacterium]